MDVFVPSEDVNDARQTHVAVGDFMLLCASVDNIYSIGGKQYGIITLHYIQGGRIPPFRGRE